MVVITKSGNKLNVKDEATARDMVEKNAGWKIDGEEKPEKPSRKSKLEE